MSEPKIDTVGSEVEELQAAAKVCRTTFEGIEEMREAGETYLPKNPRETPEAYTVRLAATDFFPALQKAVNAYIGKPLGSPIVVTNAPAIIEAGLDNVNLAGDDFDAWARCVLSCGIVDGTTFAVADYPKMDPGATLAQERAAGARPYLVHVPLKNVVDMRYSVINGSRKLTHFRYKECVTVPSGRWGTAELKRIRVLEPGLVEVWQEVPGQKDTDGSQLYDLLPELSGPVGVSEVPVARFTPGQDDEPPLADLAWLNIRWWRSKSEQNHILHVARVPLLAADEDGRSDTSAPIPIGVDGLIVGFKNLHYVEHTGKAIEAGRQDILDIEDAMRRVAGQILVSESGQKSATEAALEAGEGSSQLRAWVGNFQSFLNECLRLMALFIREGSGGTAELDMDWDEAAVGADVLTALSNMHAKGQITLEVLFNNLQAAGIIPEGTEFDAFKAQLEMEGPQPMPMSTTPFSPPKKPKTATITRPDGTQSTVTME